MELNEPLNKAHRTQRLAERQVLRSDFVNALNNFKLAADYFDGAINSLCSVHYFEAPIASINASPFPGQKTQKSHDQNSLTYQTLVEQKKFCFRQAEILSLKLLQINQKQSIDNISATLTLATQKSSDHDETMSTCSFDGLSNMEDHSSNLMKSRYHIFNHDPDTGPMEAFRSKIFTKFDQHDTLLEGLGLCVQNERPDKPNRIAKDEAESENFPKNGQMEPKFAKSERVIIEELRQCNLELRACILELFGMLAKKDEQVEQLKRAKAEMNPNHSSDDLVNDQSSADNVLPKIDAVKPGVNADNLNLLDLAPLELPNYTTPSNVLPKI